MVIYMAIWSGNRKPYPIILVVCKVAELTGTLPRLLGGYIVQGYVT